MYTSLRLWCDANIFFYILYLMLPEQSYIFSANSMALYSIFIQIHPEDSNKDIHNSIKCAMAV